MKKYLLGCLILALSLIFSPLALAQGTPGQNTQTAQMYAAKILSATGSDIVDSPIPGTIKITIKGKTTGIKPHDPESEYLRLIYYAPEGTEDWCEHAINKTDQTAPGGHLDVPVEGSLVANLPDPIWPVQLSKAKTFRVKLVLKEYTLDQFHQVNWVIRVVDLGTVTIRKTWIVPPFSTILVSYNETPASPPDPTP